MADRKVGQAKEKDFDSIMPRFGFCDMNDATKNVVIDTCREACKMQHDNELKYFKDMAGWIKSVLDKKQSGSWHVIVGMYKSFPSKFGAKKTDRLLI